MKDPVPEDDERAARRILDLYKRLVLLGKARLPLAEARRLVGPDCAYHLYVRHAEEPPAGRRRGSKRVEQGNRGR